MKENNKKESIMKGYMAGSGTACSGRRRISINDFPQRDYNYEKLEKKLLQAQCQKMCQESDDGAGADTETTFQTPEGGDSDERDQGEYSCLPEDNSYS